MKKFMSMMIILLATAFAFPVLAQVIDPPGDIIEVVTKLETYIGSLAGLAALSVFITGLLNGWFKVQNDWLRRFMSWLVPIVISLSVGLLFKAGFLAEKEWYIMILYGLGAGLFSNGLFSIDFINTAIYFIEDRLGNKQE